MFEDPKFDIYDFDSIPTNRDCYLMSEIYLEAYEKQLINFFHDAKPYNPIGYVTPVAVTKINLDSVEISWYAFPCHRFHEVKKIILAKDDFIFCVGSWECDEKPHIFVKDQWLKKLYSRFFTNFALIDAIGVKKALKDNKLKESNVVSLRDDIDKLAKNYPSLVFISFADSIIIKSNWTIGDIFNNLGYTYQPEILFDAFKKLKDLFKKNFELDVYGIFTQGVNEYCSDGLIHISESKNHIGLNSLGAPFKELMDIDKAIRKSIKNGRHGKAELYLEETFYHSLNKLSDDGDNILQKYSYGDGNYYFFNIVDLLLKEN